ncbi:hypothetical protein QR680_012407 [Steinernema hermaphroditum]|uniref:SH3 domain-containing protein n=1 Tax=Steinernema hermaphroditum TaxID=289476 RepID=A0AA39I486_9BILA|nr:hypothetical protein QR680_012407 [Steinernema hermaphroditum]
MVGRCHLSYSTSMAFTEEDRRFPRLPAETADKMSDLFGKHLKKQTARAKEKLLEGLGKAKATQDELFDQQAANMAKQAKAAEKFQRDLKAYGEALKGLVKAEKALRDTVRELYEDDWPNKQHMSAITQTLDIHSDDLEKSVNENLLGDVATYVNQFSELKNKIAKRGRKLVDFDHARNHYSSTRSSSKRGDDDPKVVKAAAEQQEAEKFYKEINKELLDQLPAVYDSRITFFVSTLQSLFDAQSLHQTESAKLNKTLVAELDGLGNAVESLRVPRGSVTPSSTNSQSRASTPADTPSTPHRSVPSTPPATPQRTPKSVSGTATPASIDDVEETAQKSMYPKLSATPTVTVEKSSPSPTNGTKPTPSPRAGVDTPSKGSHRSLNPFDESDDDETNPFKEDLETDEPVHIPGPAGDSSSKVLHKVRATHKYTAQDTDELTFEAGEVIRVLEPADKSILDEGWLLGRKESDDSEGLFPANYTKPL